MAASAKPRALVFGHSFVRRFGEFINTTQPNYLYRRDLQLVNTYEVEIFGTGGRTVDKTISFDLDAIGGTCPNVVVPQVSHAHCVCHIGNTKFRSGNSLKNGNKNR